MRPGAVLVLRPDKYVFGATANGAALTAALVQQLGLTGPVALPSPPAQTAVAVR